MGISKDLEQFFQALRPVFSKNGHRVKFYAELAKRLSQISYKEPPWSWRYVQSVEAGTVKPSKRFRRAIELLAGELDGMPAFVADTESVTIYARPGTIRLGTIVLGESQLCAHPPCQVWFVRTHPRQKYCPAHKDPKNRK